jgi:hypothetical protein
VKREEKSKEETKRSREVERYCCGGLKLIIEDSKKLKNAN